MEKIRQYFRERQFILKVFLIVFVFLIVLVVLMNLLSFHFLNTFLMEEIDNLMYSTVSDIDTNLSHNISQYQKTCQTIYSMPKVQSFLLNQENPVTTRIEVAAILQPFLTVHYNVDSIFLFKGQDVILERDARYQSLAHKQKMVEEIQNTTSDIAMLRVESPLEEEGYKLVLFSTYRSKLYAPPEYGVAMIISPQQLADTVFPKEGESFGGFQILTPSQEVLLQRFYPPATATLLPSLGKESFSDAVYHSQVVSPKQGLFFLSQLDNTQGQYVVYSLADYDATFAKVRSSRTLVSIVFLCLGILAFFVAFYIANRIHRPVNHMLTEIWSSFGAPLGNRFSGSFLDASLSITTTSRRIKELEQQREEECFSQFIEGELTTLPEELVWLQNTYSQDSGESFYEFLLGQSRVPINETQKEHIGAIAKEWFEKETSTKGHFLFFPADTQFALLCAKGTSPQRLKDLHQRIESVVSPLCLAQTRPSGELEEVPKLLQEAQELLRHQVFRPQEVLFPYTMETRFPSGDSIAEVSQKAISLVQTQQHAEISAYGQMVFDTLRLAPYDDGILILANLITDIENTLMHMTVDSQEYQAFFLNHYLSLLGAVHYEEAIFQLTQALEDTCLGFEILQSHTMRDTLQKALDYIDTNYQDYRLSVDCVAEYIHISPSYFSKIFNNYTNSSFPEYLNSLRLEKASQFLLQSRDFKIKTIAKQVGFSSSSYFSSAFRKKYGLTPTQYRQHHKDTQRL